MGSLRDIHRRHSCIAHRGIGYGRPYAGQGARGGRHRREFTAKVGPRWVVLEVAGLPQSFRRGLELHDSRVSRIDLLNRVAAIHFSHGYIHKSKGMPGRDRGQEGVRRRS